MSNDEFTSESPTGLTTNSISSTLGGALIGSSFGGVPGAIIGGVIGAVIGFTNVVPEFYARHEITKWEKFFASLPENEFIDEKTVFIGIISASSNATGIANWKNYMQTMPPERMRLLEIKKKNYETEMEKIRSEMYREETRKENLKEFEALKHKIQDLSPEKQEELLNELQRNKAKKK